MFPSYLLTDRGFWAFAAFYVLSVVIIVPLMLLIPRRTSNRPDSRAFVPTWVVVLFTYLIIEQFFHQAEHVTQMYQFQFLGMTAGDSHGFVWFLDDEWNHFVFNALYMTGITIVFAMLYRSLRAGGIAKTFAHTGYMVMFLFLEGWHMVEHTYRIIHHAQGLCDQCAGILDPASGINRLVIHFWFNFFALIFPVAVYVWYGLPELLKQRLQRKRSPAVL